MLSPQACYRVCLTRRPGPGVVPAEQSAGRLVRLTYMSNGAVSNRHSPGEILSYRIVLETRYLDIRHAGGTMIPSPETERMWAPPARLEDSADTCL